MFHRMYCSLACVHAVKVLKVYLKHAYYPLNFTASALLSYSPPGVIYNKLFSSDLDISLSTCFCLLIFWGAATTGMGCIGFFLSQILLVVRGQTPYEFMQKNREYDYGVWKNIELVFGKLWFVYFIVPFPQKFPGEKAIWGVPNHVQNV